MPYLHCSDDTSEEEIGRGVYDPLNNYFYKMYWYILDYTNVYIEMYIMMYIVFELVQ